MKIICAWCQTLIGYKCSYCGGPLHWEIHAGRTMLVCDESPMVRIIFSLDSTRKMPISHGICPDCLKTFRGHRGHPLTPEEILAQAEAEDIEIERRANLAQQIERPK